MGKDRTQRVDETLHLIEHAPDLTGGIRLRIRNLVRNQFPRMSANDLNVLSQLSDEMSVTTNMPLLGRGSPHKREQRRAIFLLWKTLGKMQGDEFSTTPRAQRAMTMGVGAVGAAFSAVMLKAAVLLDAFGAQHVFEQELSAHPVRFLKQHRIVIVGTLAGVDRFSNAPTGDYQNTLLFHFQYDIGTDKFVLKSADKGVVGVSHPFNAVSVPAVHWTQVPNVGVPPDYNFAGVLGCELVGATFMLTTQFTGCAFNWTNYGGMLRASHVSPAGGGVGNYPGGGITLAQRMMANGAMANAGNTALTVFGAGAGNAPVVRPDDSFYPDPQDIPFRWVSIFGVQRGGAWRFYTQVIGQHEEILQARRIM